MRNEGSFFLLYENGISQTFVHLSVMLAYGTFSLGKISGHFPAERTILLCWIYSVEVQLGHSVIVVVVVPMLSSSAESS